MATIPQVVGPSGTVYSRNADAERTINWYVEGPDGGAASKNPHGFLNPTPGLVPFTNLSAGPVRGIYEINGRTFAVGGNSFEEIFPAGEGHNVVLGTVGGLDVHPVTFASSGTQSNQLALTSAGQLYVLDLLTNVLTHVTNINFMQPVQTVLYMNNSFVTLRGGTRQIYYSALLDATAWDPLQVIEVSLFSDNLNQIGATHTTILVIGSQHALFYIAQPDADIPFQPIPEALMEHGIYAPWSLASIDNTLFWLESSANGALQVMRLSGYSPQRISSFSAETFFNRAEGMDQSIGWCYSEAGHSFYVLYAPQMQTSWTYDVATGVWCERSLWRPSRRRHYPYIGRCHAFAFGKHLIGDRQSGTIYRQGLDLTTYTITNGTGL